MLLIGKCASCGQALDHKPRFWSQVKRVGRSKCWPWLGAIARTGYGKFQMNGKTVAAHRVAYVIANGPIKSRKRVHDTCVCHTCDNRACVNPAHLYLDTQMQNIADRETRGRGRDQLGMKHNMAKLTDAKVKLIRRRVERGEMQKDLAAEFGMSKAMICLVVNRKNWTHI